MFCSLSGQKAQEPVISPKSGKIFEKRLIVTYLAANNKDPINDEPLTVDELVPVDVESENGSVIPPKPPAFNSIPSLLSTFQNEFDSMALEVFSLRKQLNVCKQELSSALYHYDAAVKVAANAIKERDESKKALQDLSVAIGNGHNGQEQEEEQLEGAIPVDLIETTRAELFQIHKSQKIPPPVGEEIVVELDDGETLKKHNASYLDEAWDKLLINHGKEIVMTDLDTNQDTRFTHRGNLSGLNLIEFNGLVTPIYGTKSQVKFDAITVTYPQDIVDIQTHPKLKSLYVVSTKNTWTLNEENKKLLTINVEGNITTSQFHIDGEIFAVGTDSGSLLIYRITNGALSSTLSTKYNHINKLEFGMNGYWLAVSSTDAESGTSALEVFDLRKSVIINTIDSESLQDFVLDKSCSVIVTVNDTVVTVHRYFKKGKSWSNFFKEQDVGIVLDKLFVRESDEAAVRGLGLAHNKLYRYEIVFK